MNWEAIGSIGEVVGAIGVIATLGYLAVQIRQNSAVVRASIRQAISSAQLEIGIEVAKSADLTRATLPWVAGEPPANDEEAATEDFFMRANFRGFENQYQQHADGTFDDAMWSGYREHIRRIVSLPRMGVFWAKNRALYGADFAAFIDALIHQAAEASRGGESHAASDFALEPDARRAG